MSLHFNWLITAQRRGDLERARDALAKLRAIAPQDWRTRVADAYVIDKSGDAAGAFRVGQQVFLDLVAEQNDDEAASQSPIEYVAGRVSEIVLRARDELREEATTFVGDLFAAETFTAETLNLIRAVEEPEATGLSAYYLQVEALYRDQSDPFGCFVNYRVLARDKDQAAAFAQRFEERCGANEVRVREADIEQLERCEGDAHAGVCWRSGRTAFPAEEFGTNE